jgi:hypothetical protein
MGIKWMEVGIAVLSLSLTAAAQERATPDLATKVQLDGAGTGRTFGGVGAISGGGGNSRLLSNYPAKQRNEILDYLFKPGYGASLQILKLEIGGDANSTDGSEPSVEHTRGVVNCNAGYEFWLAEEAKRRNPNLRLYGLAWAAPGWIGGGKFWSQDTVDYLMTWLDCAHSHGLTIDYLGGWNERGFDARWYEGLHAALAAKHSAIKIVGDDSDWKVAAAMAKDPEFAKSIDIIGVHYSCEGGDGGSADSCHSTAAGVDSGKPLWDSENGSQDANTGAGPLIRAITRGYLDYSKPAVPDRWINGCWGTLVRQLQHREKLMDHRACHSVHPTGVELCGRRERLYRRRPSQRQLRFASLSGRSRREHHCRDFYGCCARDFGV